MAFSILEEVDKETKLMDAKRMAKLLGCTPKHIYSLANQKAIPCLKVGSKFRFDPRSISYWLRKKDPTLAAAAKSAA